MLKPLNAPQSLSKADYKTQSSALRLKLLEHQFSVQQKDRSVILVIAGDDRSGRHETINALLEWFDPRFIRVNAYGPHDQVDEQRPFFWRFWRDLPGAGRLGIYLREWTSTTVVQYLNNDIDHNKLQQRIEMIRNFEKQLSDDGALIIKVWLHLSKQDHKERLDKVHDTVFFEPKDELALKNYDTAVKTIDEVLAATDAPHAPWHVVDGAEPLQRNLVVGQSILKQMASWSAREKPNVPAAMPPTSSQQNVLNSIDLSRKLDKKTYEAQLKKERTRLRELMNQAYEQGISIVCAFEGVDAAGKGGAIRRIATALDAGHYRIVPVAKPTDEELARHYLWRFWRHMPPNGLMTIFDRTWYGRVLVERVEGFAEEHEWQRAYQEINDFEKQLSVHGTVLVKFWLHIDQQEQKKRFEAREKTPHKKYKITEEDYRNREKWPEYREAIHDMISQTDTPYAPWSLISAQDKKFARVEVLKILNEKVSEKLRR